MKKKKDEIIDTLSVISNKWATPSNYFTVSFEFSKYRDLYYAKYYSKGGGGGMATWGRNENNFNK